MEFLDLACNIKYLWITSNNFLPNFKNISIDIKYSENTLIPKSREWYRNSLKPSNPFVKIEKGPRAYMNLTLKFRKTI